MTFDDADFETSEVATVASGKRVPAWVWGLLVFAIGIVATALLAKNEQQRDLQEARQQFSLEAKRFSSAVERQLHACDALIRSFQTMFLASEEVTPDEYARAYENMRANGVAQVSLQALAYVERRRRSDGDHFITAMFAPLEGNQPILGLDVASQPANLEALKRSRDTDQVAMSSTFRLRQSGNQSTAQDGFILRLPVYAHGVTPETVEQRRSALVGSIGASFRISDLIESVLPSRAGMLASVQLEDTTHAEAPVALYSKQLSPHAEGFTYAEDLRFGGRVWRIVAHMGGSAAGYQDWQAVAAAGALISLLLAALAWSLVATRERAYALSIVMSQRYRDSQARFRMLNELLPSLVMLARRDNGVIVYRNAAARNKLASKTGFVGLATMLPPEILSHLNDAGSDHLSAADVQMHDGSGALFWVTMWISAIEIEGVPMWLLVANDISEQRHLAERLSFQSRHDSLTRLFNRAEFESRVQTALQQGHKNGALLFVDLDQFKLINDVSGHAAGDALLIELAKRIREELRPGDILGRLGGDEFGVLLASVPSAVAALQTAERLRRSIEEFVFNWEQRIYTISASIGVVMTTEECSVQTLFAHADAACYLAKEMGRNRIQLHSGNDAVIASRMGEMEWINRIRDAMRDGRLLLDYQELHPVRSTDSHAGHIELLLRLRDENGNVVPPGEFLPAAERYGLMPQIDRWVVETALEHLDHLHPSGAALATCAINLSGASMEDESLFERIEALVALHQIAPQRLLFEITETVAMRDIAASRLLMSRLRDLGCRVALDDFGAGMSSFGYLRSLELDVLKIDGSFVQSMAAEPTSQAIIKAVTEIGHLRGLQVIAEWVSSEEILALLVPLQVDFAQGFALHKPERVVFQRSGHD